MNSERAEYRLIVTEDEEIPREYLLRLLSERPEFQVVAVARDGREARQALAQHTPDLLITDISLPYHSGIEVVESLSVMPYVIFATSYDHFAARAFELGAVDYIVKPVQRERLHQALDRFLIFAERSGRTATPESEGSASDTRQAGLSVNESGTYYFVPHESIVYIQASDRKTVLHTTERTYAVTGMIKSFEEKLEGTRLMRIHKTYMINTAFFSHLKYLDKTPHVFLNDQDETTLPVGRKYLPILKERLQL
ncbi:MAG: LytTR family DNA-binding domain-containing protein [bacterium]|nr:LytTR family DNA-binding domain-containing protein [bacterium]